MTKKKRVLILVALIVGILSGTASAFEGRTIGVYLQIGNGEMELVSSQAVDVEGFIKEQRIELGEYDSVKPDLSTPLEEVSKLQILHGVTVFVTVDGNSFKANEIKTKQMMVNQFVAEYSLQTGTEYLYDLSMWSDMLTDGMNLDLTSKKQEIFTITEAIPYETQYIDTTDYYEGTEVVVIEGAEGELAFSIRVDFVGGEEVSREILSEEVTAEAVDAIIMRGTAKLLEAPSEEAFMAVKTAIIRTQKDEADKAEAARIEAARIAEEKRKAEEAEKKRKEEERIAAEKAAAAKAAAEKKLAKAGVKDLQYVSEMTMVATAYTSDYASTGKRPGDKGFGITRSGMKARVGVVAVDPSVIPLGTKLYIEGYGQAIAGDTGSGIKGKRIDLYFNTSAECYTFGRQSVKVYILK